ncbi:hypothetical protein K5X82_11035 [Halosquirtibacter xylanolyticus]|nr:hypothetical protein K5X82_11035 [Prolixibacteraceae bacterium]
MANITGLTVARNSFSNSVRDNGLLGENDKLVLYCSEETHSCITKAAEIIITLQEKGIASPSSTILDGNYCIKACIVNHKTIPSDLEEFISSLIRIGNKLCFNDK